MFFFFIARKRVYSNIIIILNIIYIIENTTDGTVHATFDDVQWSRVVTEWEATACARIIQFKTYTLYYNIIYEWVIRLLVCDALWFSTICIVYTACAWCPLFPLSFPFCILSGRWICRIYNIYSVVQTILYHYTALI